MLDRRPMDLYTLASNLSRRRTHFSTRAALAVRDLRELEEGLEAVAEERAPVATAEEGEPRLAMVFAGQGTQWAGCGRALYDADPVFRRVIDAVDAHWREFSEISLRDACFSAPQSELDRRNLQHRPVPGNIAFHSRAMDAIREDVAAVLSFLDERAFDLDVPFISSVTGGQTERLDSAYWWSNIRRPVRFAAAMDAVKRDHRPDIVLELAPHCALQPVIAQCLADGVSTPVSIATFMRDTDTRLGFLESLGALFRAGVTLDFASRYPRPEPVPHLLPGHPRDEEKKADVMADDEFHNQGAEYSHGPLVGHRIPCDHLLFEARFSDRAFPWAADHVVHHAAIMPAAGYVELVLEAFGGVPVHFDVIEFLQPCPVPRIPVRLQTAVHPVADAPAEFTFVVTTRPYGMDAKGELHCRGKVRVSNDPPSGPRLTCLVKDPPDRTPDIDEMGQFNAPDGEGLSGSISFYDRATGALVAHIPKYIHVDSNPRRSDLTHSKHRFVWQLKFLPDGRMLSDRLPDGEIEPATLIAALDKSRAAGAVPAVSWNSPSAESPTGPSSGSASGTSRVPAGRASSGSSVTTRKAPGRTTKRFTDSMPPCVSNALILR